MSKEIVCASREEWLAERKNGIGASEVATALGVNPFKSAFELWAEITGLAEAENLDDREAIIWGKLLEGPIIGEFGRRTGRVVEPHNQNVMLIHPTHEFLRGTPDSLQRRSERADPGDLQIKTTSLWNQDAWADGAIPIHYQIQVQAELSITGYEWGSIAVLIGGQRLVYYDIERDDRFLNAMLPELEAFWALVVTRKPPVVDARPNTRRILSAMHPDDDGSIVMLPDEAVEWQTRLADSKALRKGLDEEITLNENRLRAAIGSSTYGELPNGGGVFSLKTTERAPYMAKASKFRTLRFTGGVKDD